jgi:hypothetical protein
MGAESSLTSNLARVAGRTESNPEAKEEPLAITRGYLRAPSRGVWAPQRKFLRARAGGE